MAYRPLNPALTLLLVNGAPQSVSDLRSAILNALDTYVYLSTRQCYMVIAKRGTGRQTTWERALRRALRLTEAAGLITHGRIFEAPPSKHGFATITNVYFLTKKGAGLLPRGAAPYRQRKPASLLHEIAVTEFHIELRRTLQAHPALKLHWIQGNTKKGTNPDAIFGIENVTRPRDRSTFWFFLEMELSRAGRWRNGESQKVRKVARYDTYRHSGGLTKDWSYIGDMRIVFHEETTERMLNFLDRVSRKFPRRFIWITSGELIREKGMLASIYYTPRDCKERSYSFLELFDDRLDVRVPTP